MKLYLHGELLSDTSTISSIIKDLDSVDGPVDLEITSEGGDTYSALALYNKIKHRKALVTTIANGMCMSAAVLVYAAGHTRLVYSNTAFMVHEYRFNMDGPVSRARRISDQSLREQLLYAKLLAANSSLTQQQWIKLMNVESYFNEQESVKYGLSTKVIK